MTQELVMSTICECTATGECMCSVSSEGCMCECECVECETDPVNFFTETCACGGNCGCSSV